jgi:hypothetical protein
VTLALGLSAATTMMIAYWSNWNSSQYTSWDLDVSMILTIISFPLTIVGIFLYCIGWRSEVELAKVSDSSDGNTEALMTEGHSDSHTELQILPQQVALNVNGQAVMATITPAASASTPAASPSYVHAQYQQPQHVIYMANPSVQPQPQMMMYGGPHPYMPQVFMNNQPVNQVYPNVSATSPDSDANSYKQQQQQSEFVCGGLQ